MILADSVKVAKAIIETLRSTKQNVLIQKFVGESSGRDICAFVVGDRVVAAMRRTAQGGDFRSNVHRGGLAEAVELDSAYRETAVRSAQIMGLKVTGVDMLEGEDGPQVMEVNSSPGLEGAVKSPGPRSSFRRLFTGMKSTGPARFVISFRTTPSTCGREASCWSRSSIFWDSSS